MICTLNRNAVKLSLYQHFTNTLVFAVVASLIFMLWSIYYHQMVTCLTVSLWVSLYFVLQLSVFIVSFLQMQDWKELWLDEAFWKLLFSLLLLVIMLLWRPTNNNQRYAFTPLLDSGDETEEDDIVVHDNLSTCFLCNTFLATFLLIQKLLFFSGNENAH